jgi:hypothetical protein
MRNVDLETFKALDAETRKLVLRMLDHPTEADHDALQRHPNCQMLSSWLLNLPAYENAPDDDAE